MLSPLELRDKILANIKVDSNGCWVWQKSKGRIGYGQISIGRQKQAYAHRVAYKVFKGDLTDGLVIMHSCDNPSCCNPDHLSEGTHKDNIQDCVAKGRLGNTVFSSASTSGESNVKSKLTRADVEYIRTSEESRQELAVKFSVSDVTIGHILRRKTWL